MRPLFAFSIAWRGYLPPVHVADHQERIHRLAVCVNREKYLLVYMHMDVFVNKFIFSINVLEVLFRSVVFRNRKLHNEDLHICTLRQIERSSQGD
jgi:hypothetical protein